MKNYRTKSLTFLQNNEDRIAIPDYSDIYRLAITTYPNAHHVFDHEFEIEAILASDPLELYGEEVCNFQFIDSKNCRFIQISDVIVGLVRMWLSCLEADDTGKLDHILPTMLAREDSALCIFRRILRYSLEVSTGFKSGVACDTFETKIVRFLTY